MAISLRQAMRFNWKLTQDGRNLSPVPRSSSGPHFSPLLPTLKFEVSSQSLPGDVISPKALKPSNDEHSQRYIPNPDICPKCQACIFLSHVARVSPILYKACLSPNVLPTSGKGTTLLLLAPPPILGIIIPTFLHLPNPIQHQIRLLLSPKYIGCICRSPLPLP